MKNFLRSFFTLSLLVLCGASNPASVTSIPNISAMQALGASSAYYQKINVEQYGTAAIGGGTFVWNPSSSATADHCNIIAATGVTTGRWVRQNPGSPENVANCGVQADGSTNDTAAMNFAIALGVPLSLPAGLTLKINSGLNTLDIHKGGIDCQGATMDFSSIGSGTALTVTNNGSDINTISLDKYHPIQNCKLIGPNNTGIAVDLTAGTSTLGLGYVFTNFTVNGFNIMFKQESNSFDLSVDNFAYEPSIGHGNGTLLYCASSGACVDTKLSNGYAGANAFIVSNSSNSLCDINVTNVTADFNYVLTGDNGGGVGSDGSNCAVFFKNVHIESINASINDYGINLESSGALSWNGGLFAPYNGGALTHTLCNNQGNGIAGGLYMRDVWIGGFTPLSTAEYFCDGTGVFETSGLFQAGSVAFLNMPLYSQSGNVIPNFTFPASPLSLWTTTGTVTYDNTTAPGGTPAGVGAIKMAQNSTATFCYPASPGMNAAMQFYYKTASLVAGSANFNLVFSWTDSAGNAIPSGGSGIPFTTSADAASFTRILKANSGGIGRAPAGTQKACIEFVVNSGNGSTFVWVGKPLLQLQ